MSDVEAPGFLGFFYQRFGSSKMGNAFLAAYKGHLEHDDRLLENGPFQSWRSFQSRRSQRSSIGNFESAALRRGVRSAQEGAGVLSMHDRSGSWTQSEVLVEASPTEQHVEHRVIVIGIEQREDPRV